MTTTLRIAVYAMLFVVSVSSVAFLYPVLTRPDISLVVSVDAELNGVADDFNLEYRPKTKDDQNIMTEKLAVRIANLGQVDINDISIEVQFEPDNNWFSLVSSEQTFGPLATFSDNSAVIDKLSIGKTATIKYEVSMNATAIGTNNLLQDKSQIIFVIKAEEIILISENLYNVILPPS